MMDRKTQVLKILFRRTIISFSLFLLVFTAIPTAHAAVSTFINYQSRLRDSSSNAVTSATTIQFSIYNHSSNGAPSDTASSAGALLWTETYDQGSGSCIQIDPDSEGYFTVELSSCTSFPDYLDFISSGLYIGVKVSTDSEATPRAELGTAPFAFTADHVFGTEQSAIGTTTPVSGAVLTVEATTTSAIALAVRGFASQVADLFRIITDTGTQLLTFTAGGNLGIGTSTPSAALSVVGSALVDGDVTSSTFIATSTTATSTFPYLSISNNSSLGTVISGTWQGTTIGEIYGGTGQSTYVIGDLLYANAANSLARLATSTGGSILQLSLSTGLPSYVATSSLGIALSDTTGTLAVNRGGTGLTSYTINQLLYASNTGTIAQIATSSLGLLTTNVAEGTNLYFTNARVDARINASTTIPDAGGSSAYGDLLSWSGSLWETRATSTLAVALSDTTGTLAVSRGGTGATTLANLITLSTDTTGNFVATVADAGGLTIANSGTEDAAVTIALDLSNANVWSGLQSFANASSTLLSVFDTAYFGGIATSSFDSAGNLTLVGNVVIGGDTLNEFAGTGLTVSSNALTLNATGGTGITFSNPTISFDCSEVEGTGINCTGESITLDATGDWTGTFDGQEGSYYLDADNFTDFGNPFYTFFNATNTDALSEGSTNFWSDQARWDSFWNASTTNTSLTSLANLVTIGTIGTGVWQGTTIGETYGGTGQSTYVIGDILYADAANSLARLATSTVGSVLQLDFSTGLPSYVATSSLGIALSDTTGTLAVNVGGTGLTSYTINQLLYASDTGTIGQIATSSLGLLTTDIAEGINLYWTDTRFDNRLSATTTLPNLTTLLGLTDTITTNATTTNATTTNFFSTTASSTNLFTSNLSIANLSGFLKATAGSIATAPIDLASDITGILGVSNGGTGATSFTTGEPLAYDGSTLVSTSTLSDVFISDALTISSSGSIDKGALQNSGTLSFDWADSEVADTITLTNLTQITNRAISDTTGTLTVARGGTGLATFGGTNTILYTSSADTLTSNANFVFDNTNNHLGIGTTTPWGLLSVNPNGISGPSFAIGSSTQTDFIVTNGGNVGIGTAAPSALLDIVAVAPELTLVSSNTSGDPKLTIAREGSESTFGFNLWFDNSVGTTYFDNLYDDNTGDIFFRTNVNGTPRNILTLTGDGLVGIVDTSPSQLLDIDGTNPQVLLEEDTTAFLRLGVGETDGQAIVGFDDGDVLVFGEYSSPTDTTIAEFMRIDSSGNVGIGTTSPRQALDVTGNTRVTGGIVTNWGDYFGASMKNGLKVMVLTQTTMPTVNTHEEMIALFSTATSIFNQATTTTTTINFTTSPFAGVTENFVAEYKGYIQATSTGIYNFATDSDDATELIIDGVVVATHYGVHAQCSCTTNNGSIYLTEGFHTFVYRYEEKGGGEAARAYWQKPEDAGYTTIPAENFFHEIVNSTEGYFTSSVGIGNSTPTYNLDVTGNARFTSLVDASHFVATSTTATSTFAGGLTIETSGFVYDFSSGNVGIGTVAPSADLEIVGTDDTNAFVWDAGDGALRHHFDALIWNRQSFNVFLDADNDQTAAAWALFNDVTSSTGNTPVVKFGLDGQDSWINSGNFGIGTTSPFGLFSVEQGTETASLWIGNTGSTTPSLVVSGVNGNGNVGIGTVAPSHTLHVVSSATTENALSIVAGSLTTGYAGQFYSNSPDTNNRRILSLVNDNTLAIGAVLLYGRQDSTADIVNFFDGATEVFTILDGGNVGIGTTSPVAKLSVVGDVVVDNGSGLIIGHTAQITAGSQTAEFQVLGTGGEDTRMTLGRWAGASSNYPVFQFVKSRNATIGSNTIVADNDPIGGIFWLPDDGVDFDTVAAEFRVEVDDALPAAGDVGTAFLWRQMPGGGGAIAETMRLTAAGRLGIGTTSPEKMLSLSGTDAGIVVKNVGSTDDVQLLTLSEDGNNEFSFDGLFAGTGSTGNKLTLNTFWTDDIMTWRGDGNIGIGTTTPDEKLTIAGATTAANLLGIAIDGEVEGRIIFYDDDAPTSQNFVIAFDAGNQDLHFRSDDSATDILTLFNGGGVALSRIAASTGDRSTLCIVIGGGVITEDIAGNNCDTSSLRYKYDIQELDINGLDIVNSFIPKSFIKDSDPRQATQWGFIAEDIALSAPELALWEVFNEETGEWEASTHKVKGARPYSISKFGIMAVNSKAIQELNLNLEEIASTTASSTLESKSFATNFFSNLFARITDWLADATNGIKDFFAERVHTKEICLGQGDDETCINKDQLDTLLHNAAVGNNGGGNVEANTIDTELPPTPNNSNTQNDEPVITDEPPVEESTASVQDEPTGQEDVSIPTQDEATEEPTSGAGSEVEESPEEPATEPVIEEYESEEVVEELVVEEPEPEPQPEADEPVIQAPELAPEPTEPEPASEKESQPEE